MATIQQRKAQVDSIRDRIKIIFKYDLEKQIIRSEELENSMNFAGIRENLVRLLMLCKKVDSINLNEIPYQQLANFNEHLATPHSLLKTIADFDLTKIGNPQHHRGQLIDRFDDAVDELIESGISILNTDLFIHPGDNSQDEIDKIVLQAKERSDSFIKDSESKLNEIKQILNNAKNAAVKVGVSTHSSVFSDESTLHKTEAEKWLKYTRNMLIATAIVALLFLILMFVPAIQESNIHPLQLAISKIVVLAIFFIGISLCNKNYKAHKHNEILNKHRQNALNTFETFIKAASDDQTKNAVLLQTTQSIFSPHNTGYNSSENDSDVPNKIIEIVKSTGGKSSTHS